MTSRRSSVPRRAMPICSRAIDTTTSGIATATRRRPTTPAADFAGSLDDCYAAVRARKAQGGKEWNTAMSAEITNLPPRDRFFALAPDLRLHLSGGGLALAREAMAMTVTCSDCRRSFDDVPMASMLFDGTW